MDEKSSGGAESISTGKAFRQLVVFQVKLALDALRDFAFSPLSLVAFIVDSLTRPDYEQSLSRRIMLLGRRSDRVINLFGEYTEGEHYTVDETLGSVEQAVYSRHREGFSERGREEE